MNEKKPPEREQVTIRIPLELKEELQKEADRKGYSLNAYIGIILHKEHGVKD